jgi:iron complex transport system substrate-binding protein
VPEVGRIVSLVPAGTEIVAALGLENRLVGVTHDDDHPPSVRELPKVTSSTIPHGATSGEIDRLVRDAGQRGESTFHLDPGTLRSLRPDLVVGQTICRVCAVTLEEVRLDWHPRPRVVPLQAESIDGMFADVARLAEALGVRSAGDSLVRGLRARIGEVAKKSAARGRPRVVCLEWLDPLMSGGHWVPEQVAIAGGQDVLGAPGQRSRVVGWEEVRAARPEVLVAMPCGWDAPRALAEVTRLAQRPGWEELPAARAGRVYAVDGAAYFSRPGPRLIDGLEILAALLRPNDFAPPLPTQAVRLV